MGKSDLIRLKLLYVSLNVMLKLVVWSYSDGALPFHGGRILVLITLLSDEKTAEHEYRQL
jgi:hypothetical protein